MSPTVSQLRERPAADLTDLELFKVFAGRFGFRTYFKPTDGIIDVEFDITWGFKLVFQFLRVTGGYRLALIEPLIDHRSIFRWALCDVLKLPIKEGRTRAGDHAILANGGIFVFDDVTGASKGVPTVVTLDESANWHGCDSSDGLPDPSVGSG